MRILWIDDEPSRWQILQRALLTGTYLRKHIAVEDVVFAHGHNQINHYLNNDMHWDYVLLDGDMPLMSGVDVAQTFLAERNIPVIIVTMNPDKAKQMAGIFDDYEMPYVFAPITNPELIVRALSR